MDWNAEFEEDIGHLKSIVALLFSLAAIADRLTTVPAALRREVLGFIWPAELSGLRCIGSLAFELGVALPPQACQPRLPSPYVRYGDDPAEAANLALRQRALAFVLAHLTLLAQRLARKTPDRDLPAIPATRAIPLPVQQTRQHLLSAPNPAIRAPPPHAP